MALFFLLLSGLFLLLVVADTSPGITNSIQQTALTVSKFATQSNLLVAWLRQHYPRTTQGRFNIWEMAQLTALCGAVPSVLYIRKQLQKKDNDTASWSSGSTFKPSISFNEMSNDAELTDPGLLKKHSEFKSYTTSRYTYPKLRIFFQRHLQADKLPTTPAPLPMLVFIHGLGGSVAQFYPLLTSLVNLASCLSIDLPGCGLSSFEPKSWDAYTVEALAELVATVVEDYREKDTGQGVVLIGHSLGCSLAALIASQTSPLHPVPLSEHIKGFVAICPRAEAPNKSQVAIFRRLLWIPGPVFNLWRKWDRRGGPESASVRRFVGAESSLETRAMQVRFNEQSRTPVWRRMAAGTLPSYRNGKAAGGLPGKDVWAGLEVPVFLVAGEADNVTSPGELGKISEFLGKSHPVLIDLDEKSKPITDSAAPIDLAFPQFLANKASENEAERAPKVPMDQNKSVYENPSILDEKLSVTPEELKELKLVLKTTILPAPASHALLYMPSTVRTLAGLISDFLCSQVSPRLSLGWQLQYLSTAGKWDVKNLAKWKAVEPVSGPIAGIFRAMKTLREVDDLHCPETFVKHWGDQIKDIVDISHESPVYDPRGLENGGIHYHKLPTVSKIPPAGSEIKDFIDLVDRLREKQKTRADSEEWNGECYIAVHCHYGYNRTGYFIVCYLVERCGYSVQAALDEFAKQRPKGIRHAHFMDQLFVRYCVGLRRAPTL